MNRNTENSALNDALDRAIREALRVEVDEHALARIEHYWRVHSRQDRWRRNAQRLLVSSAAAVALVAGAIMIWSSERGRESAHGVPDSLPEIVESAPAKTPLGPVAESVEPPPSA